MGIYTLAPMLGPVLGPVAGAWIAEKTTWRWVFWSSSAFAVVIQISGLFWLRESYAPTILRRKRERLVKETGNHALHTQEPEVGILRKLGGAALRPARMFTTQPIVMLISCKLRP